MNGMSATPGPRTATSEVQSTYYGEAVIKAPHWRWLIITYFFLGGIAGASFTIATIADLFSRDRAVVRLGRYLSFAALLPCPPLLILDLGRPERFLNMLRILKLRSVMSLGSWALVGLSVFSSLAAGLELLADVTQRGRAGTGALPLLAGPRRVVGIIGLPFSIFLSGYTGVLLAATNVPVWWRASPLLAPTFISSAYSTTLAALSLLLGWTRSEEAGTAQQLARAEVACLSAELGLLTALSVRLGKIGRPLTAGPLGLIYWPVVWGSGVLGPLLLLLTGPARGRPASQPRRVAAALLALLGGYTFRTLIIFAGRESARRPEDYFAMTRTQD